MTLAVDTNVLIPWLLPRAPGHAAVKRVIDSALDETDGRIALAPLVVWEFLHAVTDARRFIEPVSMDRANDLILEIWDAPRALRLHTPDDVVPRVAALMATHRLGRKRVLNTALAATLEAAKVRRLATFNAADFRVFPFLEVIVPLAP